MSAEVVRAVVADGSDVERQVLALVLRSGGIEVVGETSDGSAVAALVRSLRPSVVVMSTSIHDAFEATRRVMADTPTPIVMVASNHDPDDIATSLHATRVGALTVQPAPPHPSSPDFEARATRLATIVRAMADVKVVGRRRSRPPARPERAPRARTATGRIEIVAVGASTGGPPALHRFLGTLPGALPVPVLVVQHIAEGFVDGLVRWIRAATDLEVKVAVDGEALQDGVVYMAPHGSHLAVDTRRTVRLSDAAPVSGFRPSVSVLLASLADSFGDRAAGVILTGMGEDGLTGARQLDAAGGVVLAQDEESSVVFGMPRAVADLAVYVGPPEQLALRIVDLLPMDDA